MTTTRSLRKHLNLMRLEDRVNPTDYFIGPGDVPDLIAKIGLCNSTPVADRLILSPNSTYTLTAVADTADGGNGLPTVTPGTSPATNTLTIVGNGATIERSSDGATPLFRILRVISVTQGFTTVPGTLNLENVTLRNGRADGNGGALLASGGKATLTRCTLTDNRASKQGGATYNQSGVAGVQLSLTDCTLRNNQADGSSGLGTAGGGAVYSAGTATLTNCTLSSNLASTAAGGAVAAQPLSTTTIINSTIANNQAAGRGGGVALLNNLVGPTVTIRNSTITGNTVFGSNFGQGGGVYCNGTLVVSDTIIAGNGFAPGVTNGTGPDLSGPAVSQGYNLVGNGAGSTGLANGTNGDQVGTAAAPINPMLGSLQNNGGLTLTFLPQSGSPAINNGNPSPSNPPPFDQRGSGYPRFVNGRIDIGSVEAGTAPAAADVAVDLNANVASVAPGGSITFTFAVNNASTSAASGVNASFPLPAGVTAFTWMSVATGVATGNVASGSGAINNALTLPGGSAVTYTVNASVSASASGTIVATATAAFASDPNSTNNTATRSIIVNAPPPPTGVRGFAVGSGAGTATTVKLYNSASQLIGTYTPFGSFTGGASVAVGDFNNDGTLDVVCGAGNTGGPQVIVISGADGAQLTNFFAYESTFRGGVYVAVGDVTGDGRPDVITGTGNGGGPRVRVFNGTNFQQVPGFDFFAYDTAFRGGVIPAAGNVDGDARADIVTGVGVGGGPHVKVFRGTDRSLITQFFPFESTFRGGVLVAAADADGDGRAEVIASPGPGGGPLVKVYRGIDFTLLNQFFAYSQNFRGGARVAAKDLDGDGRAEVVTGPGPGGGPHVRAFNPLTGGDVANLFPFPSSFNGGVYVG